jgi:hypothetical protein
MRKTRILWTIVVLAVLLVATTGLAAAKGGQGGASFNIYGTIVALDPEALTIDVKVASPDSFKDATITVQTTGTTRFKECVDGTSYRITFADLENGSGVRVSGVVSGGVYLASSVIQYP